MLQPPIYVRDLGLVYKCHVRPFNLLYALLTTNLVALIIKGLHLFQSHKDNTIMQAQTQVEVAGSHLATHTKKEIVVMARQYGWRGDDARAPALQLALFVAGKIAAMGDKESGIKDSGVGGAAAPGGGSRPDRAHPIAP